MVQISSSLNISIIISRIVIIIIINRILYVVHNCKESLKYFELQNNFKYLSLLKINHSIQRKLSKSLKLIIPVHTKIKFYLFHFVEIF